MPDPLLMLVYCHWWGGSCHWCTLVEMTLRSHSKLPHTGSPAYPPKRGFGYVLQAGCSSKGVSFPKGCWAERLYHLCSLLDSISLHLQVRITGVSGWSLECSATGDPCSLGKRGIYTCRGETSLARCRLSALNLQKITFVTSLLQNTSRA